MSGQDWAASMIETSEPARLPPESRTLSAKQSNQIIGYIQEADAMNREANNPLTAHLRGMKCPHCGALLVEPVGELDAIRRGKQA